METNVNYTIVGAFVIILLSAVTMGIIWLSSGFALARNTVYEVYMTESVSGLSVDSPVEYNGVDVGTVKSISINHRNPRVVELLLNIKSDTPITRGTRATLNSRGLTGIAYLALKDQGTDRTPLLKADGQPYPIIETAPSLFMRLDTALSSITRNFQQVSQSIRSLLDETNLHLIRQTLLNVQQITGELAGSSAQMSALIRNTAKASEQLTPLLKSGQNAMQVLRTQTIPAANQAFSNLNDITNNLSQTSVSIKRNPAVLIRGQTPQPLGPGEK
ncbi:MAG: MlaD family protein [Gammaproteobacteria bacterium]